MEKNYNYFYNEESKIINIVAFLDYYNAFGSLPQMTPVFILKNNRYIREMEQLKLSCISNDIIYSGDYNASGQMYILFLYVLERFRLKLDVSGYSSENIAEYIEICERLIPEFLYKAKYSNSLAFPENKPLSPISCIYKFRKLPERVRFLFFLGMQDILRYYAGLCLSFVYVEQVLGLLKHEGRYSKNGYGAASAILYLEFDTFTRT